MKKQKKYSLVCMSLLSTLLAACGGDNSSAPDEPVDTFDAAIVCPADGMNTYGEPNRGTFTDVRDGQVYKYTTIGNQVWMAENLKFDAPYSVCYDKIDGFCDTFGRFYSLHQKGELFDLFDQELLDTICPAGWHVPSVEDWNVLGYNMGGGEKAGRRLMSSHDFGESYELGSDDCNFSALPAGELMLGGTLSAEYAIISYWTSTAKTLNSSYICYLGVHGIFFEVNQPKMTLRCIRN
ncbi:MAG: hypothetical protein II565_03360 [Fibrobacter sp.]|nr:hypothetical protein [Fibrobacter sp.]